jgi:NAD+ synthase
VPGPVNFCGVRLGLPICEDTWTDWGDYENVVETLAETGAELLIVPNGSPYWRDKAEVRLNVSVARVTESGLPLIYVNQVGGQDELVFDGASFALNADRSIASQLPAFREAVVTMRWLRTGAVWRSAQGSIAAAQDLDQADYTACMLGLRDYVDKNRFRGVVLGLSGGVDSALCAALAVDALGAERVRCVMLPYRYTSQESLDDAAAVARSLGVRYDIVPIERTVRGVEAALAGIFGDALRDVTEENLQARARGVILMAISNKFGLMVVTTGNKSEMSVGYATLYGDMNGGFNPIKDLYKTEVYRLAHLRNRWKPEDALGPPGLVIPENVMTRAPSAELREDQTDQDTLPPYDLLDQILERLVEREEPLAAIVAAGFDREMVMKVERMLTLAEYKRRQAAPGVKVTLKNFGRDRRYPIVNRFYDSGSELPGSGQEPVKSPARAKAGAGDL